MTITISTTTLFPLSQTRYCYRNSSPKLFKQSATEVLPGFCNDDVNLKLSLVWISNRHLAWWHSCRAKSISTQIRMGYSHTNRPQSIKHTIDRRCSLADADVLAVPFGCCWWESPGRTTGTHWWCAASGWPLAAPAPDWPSDCNALTSLGSVQERNGREREMDTTVRYPSQSAELNADLSRNVLC